MCMPSELHLARVLESGMDPAVAAANQGGAAAAAGPLGAEQ